jgi:diguanylate cyclase (GGDEF)-like protein
MNESHKKPSPAGILGFDRIAALMASLVGVLVLAGWALDLEALKRMVTTLVAMNPVTAICFILLGVSVWASHSEVRSRAVVSVAQFAAFAVLLLAGLKLCELVFGWFTGIDQLLFREKLSLDAAFPPNRMAPNTAFNFLLLAVAQIFPWKKGRRTFDLSSVLILLSILDSFLPILGYIYGTKPFYGVGQYIPMALHTALTFLLLGTGMLLARPQRPVIATLFDDGMSGIMVRRLLPAVIVLPITLGWLRLEGQKLGLYDNELGAALVVLAQILLLGLTVWLNSFLLLRLDRQRKEAEVKLSELVITDDLTNLRNRRGFMLLAEQELKLARNRQMGIVLWCLYADLDGLKQINDTLGHNAGSQAIVHTAAILKASFREADIIARLGGDEFCILAATNTHVGGNLLVERLGMNVSAFNERENLPYKISLSVGIVVIDTQELLTLDEIVKRADTKMYADKLARKNQTQH